MSSHSNANKNLNNAGVFFSHLSFSLFLRVVVVACDAAERKNAKEKMSAERERKKEKKREMNAHGHL